MLTIFYGTDRVKIRQILNTALSKNTSIIDRVRLTDTHSLEDLSSLLSGGGMFRTPRIIVFEYILAREDMRDMIESRLIELGDSHEQFYWIEEKIDATTKKILSKHATLELHDLPKKAASATTIFALANALKRGDKKELWISYQRELLAGSAPEAMHGILFWGVKDMILKSRSVFETQRGERLVAQLIDLPHRARRRGEELEYALENFVLSNV